MSNWNDYRRCAKCGKTRAEDMSVSYHRFPNPGKTNIIRASAWAKYCYPTEDWTSLEFLQSLNSKNKVLCGRHFHSSQFYDNMRQKLTKFAVPDSDEIQEFLNQRENILIQGALNDSISANSHLKDENTLLKAQVSAAVAVPSTSCPAPVQDDSKLQEYEARLQALENEVTRLTGELKSSQDAQRRTAEELERVRKDQDDLLELLADQDIKLNDYKMLLLSLGHPVEEDVAE